MLAGRCGIKHAGSDTIPKGREEVSRRSRQKRNGETKQRAKKDEEKIHKWRLRGWPYVNFKLHKRKRKIKDAEANGGLRNTQNHDLGSRHPAPDASFYRVDESQEKPGPGKVQRQGTLLISI